MGNEVISRFFGQEHSIATCGGGAQVGDHQTVFGFRNGLAATTFQAAASNQYLADGIARVFVPAVATTAATAIQLPRRTILYGNGRKTVFRANATDKVSRVFTISGQAAATNSSLTANATFNTQTVPVTDGTKFSADDWIILRDSKNVEMLQVDSVAGNTLTVREKLRYTYRSAATTSHASILYPAELIIDNMDIQLSDTTQGYGVAATWLVQSEFRRGLRIKGFANAGLYLQNSELNKIDCIMEDASAATSGKGYGVHLADSSDNVIAGVRRGTSKDFSDSGGRRNYIWGANYRTGYPASGISDPMAYWYRMRKPELSYDDRGGGPATTMIACIGSESNPAEVYINGHVFRNAATTWCDLSGVASPTGASPWIGGLTGGVAVATLAYHFYAVPAQKSTASAQWHMVACATSPATGPNSLWPQWSWLGAVRTDDKPGFATFNQSGNNYYFGRDYQVWAKGGVGIKIDLQATVKEIIIAGLPLQAKSGLFAITPNDVAGGGATNRTNVESFYLSHPKVKDSVVGITMLEFPHSATTFIGIRRKASNSGVVPAKDRKIGYWNQTHANGATVNLEVEFYGYDLDRAAYK
jgi:hypothetical protein